jgi:predicted ATPase
MFVQHQDEPEKNPAKRPGARWQVQLLGGLKVRCGDLEISRWGDRHAMRLFAHLALYPRVVHGRAELAEAVWPDLVDDAFEDSGAKRMRQLTKTLSNLNGLFKQVSIPHVSPFLTDADTVRLNAAAFEIDVAYFEARFAGRLWAQARACYRGELMPGVKDAWIENERQRLVNAYSRAEAESQAAARLALGQLASEDEGKDDETEPDVEGGELHRPLVAFETSFVGRLPEMEAVRQALIKQRVVSISGVGGCGKTRLASEVTKGLHGFAPVVPVWLAECDRPAQMFDCIRAALDLSRTARDCREQVVDHLRGRRALLVLDNFEQLAGAEANGLLDAMLQDLPQLHLLVTSQRLLGRDDAVDVPLQPLPLPHADEDLDTLRRNPCVALFVSRACDARADFTLYARNQANVVEICRLLEGVPLLIELAAANIRKLPVPKLLPALQRSIKLQARPQAHAAMPQRHLSVQATLVWTWRLLSAGERHMLSSLCIMRGGWTQAQALAQALAPQEDAKLGLALLDGLVQASLLRTARDGPGATRLSMLRMVREFVDDQISSTQAQALRQRHRDCFLQHALQLQAQGQWPADDDEPNLLQAIRTASDDHAPDVAAELATLLAPKWRARGATQQVLHLVTPLSTHVRVSAVQRMALLTLLVSLLINSGQMEAAKAPFVAAMNVAGDDPLLLAQAVIANAELHVRVGSGDPHADAEQSLALVDQARALLDRAQAEQPEAPAALIQHLRAVVLIRKGALTLEHLRQIDAAARMFEQAEQIFITLGDRRAAVLALPGRTSCLLRAQHFRETIAVASKGEVMAELLGDVTTQLQLLDRISESHVGLGQYELALRVCQRQTQLARQKGIYFSAAFGVWNQCQSLVQLNQFVLAVQLMAFASQYWVQHMAPLTDDDHVYINDVCRAAQGHLGAERVKREWARGLALSPLEGFNLASGPALAREGPTPEP